MSEESTMDIYEPVIAELRAQIEEWQKMVVNLEMMRSKGAVTASVLAGNSNTPAANGTVNFSSDAFFGMTIADAAKKYLNGIRKTATARAIADALLAGGFKTSAKNFVENVRSIISRSQHFAFVNGEFGLAEWYPGRKVAAKPRAAQQQPGAEDAHSQSSENETNPTTENPEKAA
jgi:hypothetical protein